MSPLTPHFLHLRQKVSEGRRNLRFYISLYLGANTPVIIYQMGKVGSSSVAKSLELQGVDFAFHVHRMNLDNINAVRQEYLENNQEPPDESLGERLHGTIIAAGRPARFITLVREPISRNISAFFENFRRFTGTGYNSARFSVEELVSVFINEYRHSVPLTWFDVEMKQTLDIDVYEYPFPKEKGYLSIRKGGFEVLVLKLEVDDSIKEKAIAEFLDVEGFSLVRSNVGQDKVYSRTYRDFKRTIKLPEPYVEIMCNSAFTRHFYSDVEIQSIRSKWQDRIQETVLPPGVHQELLRASSRVGYRS